MLQNQCVCVCVCVCTRVCVCAYALRKGRNQHKFSHLVRGYSSPSGLVGGGFFLACLGKGGWGDGGDCLMCMIPNSCLFLTWTTDWPFSLEM